MSLDVLSLSEASSYCGVDRRTMLRWVKRGLVASVTTGGGRHRVLRKDLVRFMKERDYPVPRTLQPSTTIVVVDDDQAHNRALKTWLEDLDPTLDVQVASDGFHGGLLVRDLEPAVLLLDVVMPGVDGFQVCARIRATPGLERTTILAMSGAMTRRKRDQLMELGADACLQKPLDLRRLESLLIDHLPNRTQESA